MTVYRDFQIQQLAGALTLVARDAMTANPELVDEFAAALSVIRNVRNEDVTPGLPEDSATDKRVLDAYREVLTVSVVDLAAAMRYLLGAEK